MPTDRPGHTRMALHPETVPWWVTFIAWAYEQVETLDFQGAPIPERVMRVIWAGMNHDELVQEAAAKGWDECHERFCNWVHLGICTQHVNPFKESSDG